MADEVTKKDLKALQNDLTKQINDLKKQLEAVDTKVGDNKREFNDGLDEENKISFNINKELTKRCDDLQNGVNALAKAISDLATRVQKLEKGR